ncbi:MAG: hypothetical protein ABEJ87_04100 [Candidatus Nanohalobium sp.]
MEYKEVFEQIMEKANGMVGEVAYRQADQVEGVNVSQDGEVEGEIGGKQVRELVEKYSDIMGEGGYGVVRQSIKEIYDEDQSIAQLELPDEVTPKEVRASQFASAL